MVVLEGLGYLGRKGRRRRGGGGGRTTYVVNQGTPVVYGSSERFTIFDPSGSMVAVVEGRIVNLAAGYTSAPINMVQKQAYHAPDPAPEAEPQVEGIF